jgi:hypothetical protein
MIHPPTINEVAVLIVGFIGIVTGAVVAMTALVNKTTQLVRALGKLRREFQAAARPKAPRH